jgi:rubrerythrin
MGNIFAGSEVVELGIQIERNGLDFYSTLAKQTKNESARGLFQYLANEEEKHIKAFQGILDKNEKYEPQGLDADDYFAYMNALAEECVFTKENEGKEIAKKIKSDKEAVDIGIGFEKDSIIFYEGIKKVVPEFDYKILDELIIQEQNHLRQLSDLKKKLI